MTVFSSFTQSLLGKAGWRPNRSVSTLRYHLALSVDGYAWFSAVEKFLSEFGGLHVTFPRHETTDTFHFNAAKAANDIDASWVQENYAQRIGTNKLCVIGQAYTDHLLLFISEAGKVYGGYDDYLCLVANSGQEAIEAICQNKSVQEVLEIE